MSDDDRLLDEPPLTDDEIAEKRERASDIFSHEFASTDVKKLAHDASVLLRRVEQLREENDRLRDDRQKLAETLRACVSDSDLADWILEITDE